MKIEKLKCDGCGAEYELTEANQLTIRILNNETEKGVSKISLKTDTTTKAIDRDSSLDFCNIACFQLYITNITKEPDIGK